MTDEQQRALTRSRNLARSFESRADATPAIRAGARRLQSVCASIEATAARQSEQKALKQTHARKYANDVRKLMRSVRTICLPLFRDVPDVRAAIRQVPHMRAPVARVAMRAVETLAALEPHAGFLASEDVDLTKLERLRSVTEQLQAAIRARAVSPPGNPTLELKELFKALTESRHALVALVADEMFAGDPPAHFSRIPKKTGRPKAKRRAPKRPPHEKSENRLSP